MGCLDMEGSGMIQIRRANQKKALLLSLSAVVLVYLIDVLTDLLVFRSAPTFFENVFPTQAHEYYMRGLAGLICGVCIFVYHQLSQRKLAHSDYMAHMHHISPVGVFHTDPQGSWVYVNQRLTQLSGVELKRGTERHWLESVYGPDRLEVQSRWDRAIRQGIPFFAEFRLVSPNGEDLWVQGVAEPYLEQGQILGYTGFVSDISERKEEAAKLAEAKERLDRALADQRDFLQVMGPELKTPYLGST